MPAELCLRRLANRHGHTKDGCPDPEAHARDVADMAAVLEAAGFVPYEAVPLKAKVSNKLISNYERPGH